VKFEIKNLSCGYDKKVIIENFNANLQDGDIFCLLGSNGVGKTTTFKTILGFLKPLGGEILIDGKDALKMSEKERASFISYVPQAHTPPFAFSVFDVVMMSANARLGIFERPSKEDEKIALDALKTLNLESFKDKIYTDLSGGERQMVLIARALAQRSKVMLLDEPTANLDFGNQMRVLSIIEKLSHEDGRAVILNTHFPTNALKISDTSLLLRNNSYLFGRSQDIITEENIREFFKIACSIVSVPVGDKVVKGIIPLDFI